jgi:hypothetical protein
MNGEDRSCTCLGPIGGADYAAQWRSHLSIIAKEEPCDAMSLCYIWGKIYVSAWSHALWNSLRQIRPPVSVTEGDASYLEREESTTGELTITGRKKVQS